MDEPYISDPRVRRTLSALARKWLYKFQGRHDIDHESLFMDIWDSLVTAKYNPAKSAPHSFATTVATLRMKDMLRAMPSRLHSYTSTHDPKERSYSVEDTEEELTLMIGQFYRSALAYCPISIQAKETRPGRPTLTMAQKAAIKWLMEKTRWSYREAEVNFARYPGILAEIGVTEPKSHQFFYRAKIAVTKFMKVEKKLQARTVTPAAA